MGVRKGSKGQLGRKMPFTLEQVQEIRRLGALGVQHRFIAARMGVERTAVTRLLVGRTYAYVPYEQDAVVYQKSGYIGKGSRPEQSRTQP